MVQFVGFLSLGYSKVTPSDCLKLSGAVCSGGNLLCKQGVEGSCLAGLQLAGGYQDRTVRLYEGLRDNRYQNLQQLIRAFPLGISIMGAWRLEGDTQQLAAVGSSVDRRIDFRNGNESIGA